MALATFRDYGISWDEEVQNTYGEKLLLFYASGLRDTSAFSFQNLYLYGGFFDLLAAVLNLISPFETYETRHLLGGLFGVAGYIGAWRLTRLLAGERAALLAVVMLACTPLLYGHNFINPKDAPFAWLTIWVAYFTCRAMAEAPAIKISTVIGFGVALGLALGARMMAFAWLGYAIAFIALAALPHISQRFSIAAWVKTTWHQGHALLWALPIAFAGMAFFWPWSIMSPLNVLAAAKEFSRFPVSWEILWNGQMVLSDHLPAAYLPLLLAVQLPEIVLLGLLLAAIAGGTFMWRRQTGALKNIKTWQYLYVITTFLLPIIACMVMRPTLYNGMRHFLFVVPPLVIVASIGLSWACDRLGEYRKALQLIAGIGIALSLGRQVSIAVDMYPNEYISYNSIIGGVKGAEGRFSLDYWGTSLAELSRKISAVEASKGWPGQPIEVAICGAFQRSAMNFLPAYFEFVEETPKSDIYIVMDEPMCSHAEEYGGQVMAVVERQGVALSRAIDRRGVVPPANP